MKPLWTVAGRSKSGVTVVLYTRSRTEALRTLFSLTDGYASCDGSKVEQVGLVDQALEQSIEVKHAIEESARRGKAQAAKRKRR